MTQRAILKCHDCKEVFRREEMVSYCSPNSKTSYYYCPKCYEAKLARERFSQTVCQIFGLKSPGPRIWKDRERIIETYGYTDDIIIDCLRYVYETKKTKKLSESLYLVTPTNVEAMMKMKRAQEFKKNLFEQEMQKDYKIELIDVRENDTNQDVEQYNLDELLNID